MTQNPKGTDEASSIIAEYNALVNETAATELNSLLAIVKRYTLPWMCDVPDNEFALPEHYRPFNDPIHPSTFPQELKSIYSIPLFYRLAFLKQLSLVSVTTHLDAQHTRLSHAIGAARVANRMLQAILNHGIEPRAKEIVEDPQYRIACIFYAFIHDAFHGPMGHTLDIMKDVFETGFQEKLDESYFRLTLQEAITDNGGSIAQQLRRAAEICLPGSGVELLKKVEEITTTTTLDHSKKHLWFLRDIVDSKIDADRLDYLARDSRVLSTSGLDLPRIEELIDSARAVLVGESGAVHLAFHERFQGEIAELLRTRRMLYSKYYEAPEKLVADDMLCHAVFFVLRAKQLLRSEYGFGKDLQQEIVRHFLLLTDDDLFGVLAEMRAPEIAYRPLVRLRQHRYYRIVYRRGISIAEWDGARSSTNAWKDTINKFGSAVRKRPSERPKILQLIAQESESYLKNDLNVVVGVQRWGIRGFLDRHEIEKTIWKILKQLDFRGDARRAYVQLEYGAPDCLSLEDLDQHPPIHFTTTSYFDEKEFNRSSGPHRESEASPIQGFTEWTKEQSRPQDIYFWDDAGNVLPQTLPVDANPTLEFYPVVLSAPETLVTAFGSKYWRDSWKGGLETSESELGKILLTLGNKAAGGDVLREAMFAALRRCAWLWPHLKNEGIGV